MEIQMIYVLAAIHIKEGSLEEFLKVFKANMPAVLAEDGCIEYVPTVDAASSLPPQQLDPAVVTIVEKWQSLGALHAHINSPHMLDYREKTKDLVENMTLKVLTPA
jgi:quinol monooxygenase YgiN